MIRPPASGWRGRIARAWRRAQRSLADIALDDLPRDAIVWEGIDTAARLVDRRTARASTAPRRPRRRVTVVPPPRLIARAVYRVPPVSDYRLRAAIALRAATILPAPSEKVLVALGRRAGRKVEIAVIRRDDAERLTHGSADWRDTHGLRAAEVAAITGDIAGHMRFAPLDAPSQAPLRPARSIAIAAAVAALVATAAIALAPLLDAQRRLVAAAEADTRLAEPARAAQALLVEQQRLRAALQALEAHTAATPSALRALADLAAAAPADTTFAEISLRASTEGAAGGFDIAVRGETPSPADLLRRLSEAPAFRDVRTEAPTGRGDQGVARVHITARWTPQDETRP